MNHIRHPCVTSINDDAGCILRLVTKVIQEMGYKFGGMFSSYKYHCITAATLMDVPYNIISEC